MAVVAQGILAKRAGDCVHHGGETNNTGVAARLSANTQLRAARCAMNPATALRDPPNEISFLHRARARGQKTDRTSPPPDRVGPTF